MHKTLQKTGCKSNSFSDLLVMEQEEKSRILQTKAIIEAIVSDEEKRSQLNTTGRKF